jgi:hypothetical protein
MESDGYNNTHSFTASNMKAQHWYILKLQNQIHIFAMLSPKYIPFSALPAFQGASLQKFCTHDLEIPSKLHRQSILLSPPE